MGSREGDWQEDGGDFREEVGEEAGARESEKENSDRRSEKGAWRVRRGIDRVGTGKASFQIPC